MSNIKVESLILECGRMCNMNCPHCLRGDSQNIHLKFDWAKTLIDQCESIGSITFTGGEPTLYTDFICKVIDYIIENNKTIGSFYIASNGKIIDYKLLCKLAEFYGYIEETMGEAEYTCRFDISNDHYHEEISNKNLNLFKAFTFVGFRGDIIERALILEGRAQENGMGTRVLERKSFSIYDETIEMVYLNSKGYLIPDCDYSYDTQENFVQYHIDTPQVLYQIYQDNE